MSEVFDSEACLHFRPPQPDVVASFELQHQIELPPDYKEFLQLHGGGTFSNCFIDYAAASQPDPAIVPHAGINWLRSLHGLSREALYGFDDLSSDENDNRLWADDSGQLLLIGNTIDESNLFLSLGGPVDDKDFGWVYLHQGAEELYLVAESIQEFLTLLKFKR